MTSEVGVKYDNAKLPYHLVDLHAEREMVAVLHFGARKYTPHGWREVDRWNERYAAALRRHVVDDTFAAEMLAMDVSTRSHAKMTSLYDEESGLLHIAHANADAHFLLGKRIQMLQELGIPLRIPGTLQNLVTL